MTKYLIAIGAFIGGGIAGYMLGRNQHDFEQEPLAETPEYVTEFVYDTIVEKERVEVPVYIERENETEKEKQDSIDQPKTEKTSDTLKEKILPRDTADAELIIRRDQKLAVKRINVQWLEVEVERDSLIKEMLGIKESKVTEMNVEFWESPLSFSGYKLSKSQLILYGLPDQFEYEIFRKNERYYLTHGEICYELVETHEFLPYKSVDKKEILND